MRSRSFNHDKLASLDSPAPSKLLASKLTFLSGILVLGFVTLLISEKYTTLTSSSPSFSSLSSLTFRDQRSFNELENTDIEVMQTIKMLDPMFLSDIDNFEVQSNQRSLFEKKLRYLGVGQSTDGMEDHGSDSEDGAGSRSERDLEAVYVYQILQAPYLDAKVTPYVIDEQMFLRSSESEGQRDQQEQLVSNITTPTAKARARYYHGDVVIGFQISNEEGKWLKISDTLWLPIEAYNFDRENGVTHLMHYVKRLKSPDAFYYYQNLDPALFSSCSSSDVHARKVCEIQKQIRDEMVRLIEEAEQTYSQKFLSRKKRKRKRKKQYQSLEVEEMKQVHPNRELSLKDLKWKRTCEKMKSWSRCMRLGYCAWRRLPNKEFCFLDNAFSPPDNMSVREYDPRFDYDYMKVVTSKLPYPMFETSGDEMNEEAGVADLEPILEDKTRSSNQIQVQAGKTSSEVDEDATVLQTFYRNMDLAYSASSAHQQPNISTKSSTNELFFVYQPSGGMNNQRLQLGHALIISRLLNRTCIIPPAAPHTNFFENYNRQPGSKLTSFQRILNSKRIQAIVDVKFIPQGDTLVKFVNKNIDVFGVQSWKVVNKDYRKYKVPKKWGEKDIKELYGEVKQKFLFFGNHSMWASVEWKGTKAGYYDKRLVLQHVTYNDVIKKIARKLSNRLSLDTTHFHNRNSKPYMRGYHAVHIRRGDKKAVANFQQISHEPEWYVDKLRPFMNVSKRLYIATDEKDRAYFNQFKESGFEILFWEDLDRDILLPFLNRYPARMFMDILSIVEQLICTYSQIFLGSGYSTLSVFILRLRRHRTLLGYDTDFGPVDGLPAYAKADTTCNPLRIKEYVRPC